MTDGPHKYIRKPFDVEGWRVDDSNLHAVAAWCGGEVLKTVKGASYVKVPVSNPLTLRHTKAFVGDWVLSAKDKGHKVYTNKAFERTFDPIEVLDSPIVTQFEASFIQPPEYLKH